MKEKTINKVAELYNKGEISEVRKRVKRMNKKDFLSFVCEVSTYGNYGNNMYKACQDISDQLLSKEVEK